MNKIFPLMLASSVLTACGGGGGSSSSINTNTTTTASNAYTGKRDTAQLTANNQGNFVDLLLEATISASAVVGEADTLASAALRAESFGLFANQVNGTANTALQFQQKVIELAKQQFEQNFYQAKTYSGTKACPYGGTVTVSGDLNDTSYIGTLNFTFSQCNLGDGILSGPATLVISATDVPAQAFTDFTLSFNAATLTVDNAVYTETGSKRVIRNLATGSDQVISNWRSFNQASGWQSWEDNVKTNFTTHGDTISGSLCDGTSGCVSLATTVPFSTNTSGLAVAGDMLMKGLNSKIRLYILNGASYIDLDSNGDGIYETSTPLID